MHAIISDYDCSTLHEHLREIRDQLGILEATSVPDSEDVQRGPTYLPPSSDPLSSAIDSTSLATSTDNTSNPDDEGNTPQTEMELLSVFFPKLNERDVRKALASEPSLDAAIDHLLSVELIRGVQRTGVWPDAPSEEDESDSEWVVASRRSSASSRRGSASSGTTPTALPKARRSSSSSLDHPPIAFQPKIKAAALGRTKNNKKRPTVTIPLVDTLQRRAPPLASPAPSSSSSLRSASGPSSDVWAAFSSLSAFLAETIPRAPSTFFISYLHSPDYWSAHEAVIAALESLSATSGDTEISSDAVSMLESMYNVSLGDEETSHNLQICLRAAEGDIAAVMDLMDMITELTWWPDYEAAKERERDPFELLSSLGTSLPASRAASKPSSRAGSRPSSRAGLHPPAQPASRPITPPVPAPSQTRAVNANRLTRPPPAPSAFQREQNRRAKGIPGSQPSTTYAAAHDAIPASSRWEVHATTTKTKSNGQHVLNWRTVAPAKKRTARASHPLAASIPAYARGELPNHSSLTSRDCYARGEMEWQKRVDAIRTAARQFGSGGRKDIAAMKAGYYAAEARRATTAAKEWELEGARMVVDAQLERLNNTVDLHYATVDQAVTLALEAAEQWWSKEKHGRLTVITGKGRHSAGQRGVLGPAVARALEDNGWRVQRNDGHVAVLGR